MADFYQIQNDVNANAAANGANSDITSLTGLTTPLGVAYGGTGTTDGALDPTLNLTDVASPATALANLGGLSSATAAATYETLTAAALLAPLASPALTGTPTAPTAAANTNTTQVATTAFVNLAGTLSSNGYVKLINGLIIQWCSGVVNAGATSTINFPMAFPNALFQCYPVEQGNNQTGWSVSSTTGSGITIRNGDASFAHTWTILAIGN